MRPIVYLKLSELEIPQIEHVFLSLGFPLFFHNVMGIMNKNLRKNLFLVDFTYQLEIAKKAIDLIEKRKWEYEREKERKPSKIIFSFRPCL